MENYFPKNKEIEDGYNRVTYSPIIDESGKATADAARETILKTNEIGFDENDYKLLTNNCDQNARRWMIVRHRDVNSKEIKENDNKEKIIHNLWDDSATFYYSYDALSRLIEVK